MDLWLKSLLRFSILGSTWSPSYWSLQEEAQKKWFGIRTQAWEFSPKLFGKKIDLSDLTHGGIGGHLEEKRVVKITQNIGL